MCVAGTLHWHNPAKEVSLSCLIWVEKPELSLEWSQNHGNTSITSQAWEGSRTGRTENALLGQKFLFLEAWSPAPESNNLAL